MSPTLNYLSSTLSMIAMVFYVIGAIGYANNKDTIKNVPWITSEQSGVTAYYALKKVYIEGKGLEFEQTYSACSDNDGNACDKCEDDGKGAFGLCIIGAIIAFCAMFVCGSLSRSVSFSMQIVSIVLAALACAAGVIALGLFMGNCYDELDDQTPVDLEWGAGAILVIISMFMMAGVSILQILSTFIVK